MYTHDFGANSKSSLILQNCDFLLPFLVIIRFLFLFTNEFWLLHTAVAYILTDLCQSPLL